MIRYSLDKLDKGAHILCLEGVKANSKDRTKLKKQLNQLENDRVDIIESFGEEATKDIDVKIRNVKGSIKHLEAEERMQGALDKLFYAIINEFKLSFCGNGSKDLISKSWEYLINRDGSSVFTIDSNKSDVVAYVAMWKKAYIYDGKYHIEMMIQYEFQNNDQTFNLMHTDLRQCELKITSEKPKLSIWDKNELDFYQVAQYNAMSKRIKDLVEYFFKAHPEYTKPIDYTKEDCHDD